MTGSGAIQTPSSDPPDPKLWAPRIRAWQRQGILGATPELYLALLSEQDSRCGICRVPGAPLALDHDHATGQPRGLLCRTCNYALGIAETQLALGARSRLTLEQRGYLYRAKRRLEKEGKG